MNQEHSGLEIAIVGMSGRFPGAADVGSFWANLCDGVEAITFFDDAELRAAGVDPAELADPAYVRAQGALDGIEDFDADFFDITPRDAALLDPQQRLLLECAWEALEQAAYRPGPEVAAGVFTSVGFPRYLLDHVMGSDLTGRDERYAGILNDKDHVSTRIAYKLGLTGPALTVQTACSSSLVAVHMAAQALLAGECDLAVAGGATIRLPQRAGYLYTEGGVDSPDGHCRAFDAGAAGMVRGSGGGVVVLRRLEDAVADGADIQAVILGSAVNNDGAAKIGYTAPSVTGQARVIRAAHVAAGIDPATIGYIEAHGTGTKLGDPVEIAALTKAFRAGTDKTGYCAIGSVKPAIGHLDAGAGVAGLIKTVLAVRHGKIPASLNVSIPNPEIDWANSPFTVCTELTDWPQTPRRAGVSSFGIGGTNCHMVIEQAPTRPTLSIDGAQLLVVSGKTAAALGHAQRQLADHLDTHPELSLADVATTLNTGRKHFSHRVAVVATDLSEASAGLRGTQGTEVVGSPSVAFLFPGQGAQRVNAGVGLYRTEKAFRDSFDECAAILEPLLGRDPRDVQFGDAQALGQTRFTQPLLFALEYSLARLWMSWDIEPDVMAGHSIGEYVAACLSGVLSLEDALMLVAERGRLMQELPSGSMLAVQMPEAELSALLPDDVCVAAVNAHDRCVLSGPTKSVLALKFEVPTRLLDTSHAFHSPMMAPIADAFAERVASVRMGTPTIPYLSNVTGEPVRECDPDYWVRHMLEPVRFADNVSWLSTGPTVAIEAGPGATLTTLARRNPNTVGLLETVRTLPNDGEAEDRYFRQSVGALWTAGTPLADKSAGNRVQLPGHPWRRRRHWADRAELAINPAGSWFTVPHWQPAGPAVAVAGPAERWLVTGAPELADRVAGELSAAGHVVTRTLGERPDRIVYVAGPSGGTPDPMPEFLRLMRLVQALPAGKPLRLSVVTTGMQPVLAGEPIDVTQAALLGITTVLPQEQPGISCQVIDVEPGSGQSLIADFTGAEPMVAYRKGRRFRPGYGSISLPHELKPLDGVYLITGGHGAVGLELAAYVGGHGGNPVLVGRSQPDVRTAQRIDAFGGRTYIGDVTDTERMRQIVEQVKADCGRLDGVFHLAFEPGGGLLAMRTEADVREESAAKLGGALSLWEACAGIDLDFMVFFSSLNAFTGGYGAAAYSGVCSYLDRLAHELTRQATYPVLSVGWGLWRGLADKELTEARRRRALPGGEVAGLSPEQALRALHRLLGTIPAPHVVVSPVDLPSMIAHAATLKQSEPPTTVQPRPEVSTSYVAPANALERDIAAVWQHVLGIEEIGNHDNFTELGGDSLAATQVVVRLREAHGLELSLHDFFADPTIAGNAVAATRAAGDDHVTIADDSIDAVLREVEAMSDDEVDLRLSHEPGGQV